MGVPFTLKIGQKSKFASRLQKQKNKTNEQKVDRDLYKGKL